MNYMIKGIQALKESFFLGIIIYIVIFVLLYLFKKRRTISWNYMFEGIFCIYCVTLLNLTGIFTLSYSLNGPFNYNSHRPNISSVISGYKQPSKSAQSIEITGFIEKSKPPKIIFFYTLLPLTA